jgi:hypothetical protein
MADDLNAISSGTNLAEVTKFLGPVVMLSTECARDFDRVFDKLLTCLKVQDAVEVILIRDLAETSWELQRYSRLRGLSFERSFKQSLEFQAQRLKARQARRQGQISDLAEHATMKPADIAEAAYLEQELFKSPSEVDEVLTRRPTEFDHAHALEKHVSFHKEVELILASLSRRRNEALRMLDLYRAGLGKRVDKAMTEIIDVEHKVIDEPSKVIDEPSKVIEDEVILLDE